MLGRRVAARGARAVALRPRAAVEMVHHRVAAAPAVAVVLMERGGQRLARALSREAAVADELLPTSLD